MLLLGLDELREKVELTYSFANCFERKNSENKGSLTKKSNAALLLCTNDWGKETESREGRPKLTALFIQNELKEARACTGK